MLRQMVVSVPSGNLTDIHRDVWDFSAGKVDKTTGKRSFLYATMPWEDRKKLFVVVRGENLPEDRSIPVDEIVDGREYGFAVEFRAVRRTFDGEQLVGDEDIESWLIEHMPGFEIKSVDFDATGPHLLKRRRKDILIPAWCARGVLRVTDKAQAMNVLRDGIGRMRGFGFGMVLLFGLTDS